MKKTASILLSIILMLSLLAGSSVCAYAGELAPVYVGTYVDGKNEKVTNKTVYVNKALLAEVDDMADYIFVNNYNELLLSLRDEFINRSESVKYIMPYDKKECDKTKVSYALRKCRSEALAEDARAGDYLFLDGTHKSDYDWYITTIGKKEFSVIEYTMEHRSTVEKEEYVAEKVKEILPTVIGDTDYETIKNIHDYICESVTYDYINKGKDVPEKQLVHSAMMLHRVVCGGYATFFYRLAKEAGFKVRIIVCEALNHAWNLIELDGKWYYVDCTRDDVDDAVDSDNSTVTNQDTQYTDFLKGSADFENHNDPDEYYVGNTNDKMSSFTVDESRYVFNNSCKENGQEHEFEEIGTEYPSCADNHCTVYRCKNCNETKRELTQPGEHTETVNDVFPAGCEYNGATQFTYCSACNKILEKRTPVPKTGHSPVDKSVKAGFGATGTVYVECENCQEVFENETVCAVNEAALSKLTYYYNGKNKKPAVTVTTSDGSVLDKSSYTVKYPKDLKKPGKHKVKVELIGRYTGSTTLTYRIKLRPSYIKKYKFTKNSVKLTYKKAKSVTGYQIQRADDKKFKKHSKKIKVKGARKTSKTITKLKSKKKYYFRVRTYKKIGKKTYYSAWSSRVCIKTS